MNLPNSSFISFFREISSRAYALPTSSNQQSLRLKLVLLPSASRNVDRMYPSQSAGLSSALAFRSMIGGTD